VLDELVVEDLQTDAVTGLDLVGAGSRVRLGTLVASKVVPNQDVSCWYSMLECPGLRVDDLHERWHVRVGVPSNVVILAADLLAVDHHCITVSVLSLKLTRTGDLQMLKM
jgi:hypothetical protein